jgi:hypothetical protein
MHPTTKHLLQFFRIDQTPEAAQAVAKQFSDLADSLAQSLPDSAEKTAGLRKLLESKDCAVRSIIAEPVSDGTVSGVIETAPMGTPAPQT